MKSADPKSVTARSQPINFRIFLASPGDVHDERELARKVIDQVRSERTFRGRINLEIIAWDQPGAKVAMDSVLTPQEAIKRGLPKPSECDLVVVIFWSRMGTPLPDEYKKPDGTVYLSGTEYEYVDAVTAAKETGRPTVWIYRRTEELTLGLNDPKLDYKRQQWQTIKNFFKSFTTDNGALTGGVNHYEAPDEFRRMFKQHLRDKLATIVEELRSSRQTAERTSKAKTSDTGRSIEETDLDKNINLYRRKADTLHATLPVAGFATQLKVPIDVEDIYVPLHAMIDLRGVAEEPFADATHAEEILRKSDATLEIYLPEAFRQSNLRHKRGVVILGDPGSGKTTHLKRLLLWCLRKEPETIDLPKGMLSVFLPLRELRDLDSGLDTFIEDQLDSPHLKMPSGFGKRLLQRGNLLFLLDGLDEVADVDRRKQVSKWIGQALRVHDDCRFVVTCRFAGYSPSVGLSEDFLEMHIRPLSEDQVTGFVHNWYRIVERGLAKDPEQATGIAHKKAEQLINRLREQDFRTRRVFELTRNPLLLTNICLVHRHRGRLPQKRAILYKDCVDVLLEHWRGAKGISIEVTAQEGRRVLQPVALWIHGKPERTRATAAELAPHIEPVLKAVGWNRGNAEEFLRTIRDHSGLLTGWGVDQYGFMHLGFQEYLAAREIRSRAFTDQKVLLELARHFGESWWQEVTLLLLALEDPSLFVPFMREVLQRPEIAKFQSMLEMCLDDAAEISAQPFAELLEADPGKNKALWQQQFLALKILERIDAEKVKVLQAKLSKHPFEQLRRWMKERAKKAVQDVVYASKGGYKLVRIPGGAFMMGSLPSEKGHFGWEEPQHEVRVPEFYMGRYPVTNEEYGRFLRENPKVKEPEYWADRQFNQTRQPVVGVSWEDAQRYAAWAGLRLASEAEWEYACRAGTDTAYYTGNNEKDLDQAGWYVQNSDGKLHPGGQKKPNAWGLYDMHGSVLEWVEDDWHNNYNKAPDNGIAWIDKPRRGSRRVLRGGSWVSEAQYCRSAIRFSNGPGYSLSDVGFRLVTSVALRS